ncbi:MAG TPA: class I SAM-dependent methyltransferase [Polyangiaceae bacterium]|nr:class I SAM-dependent methyltransferase [Polyangiaceae bacterium]
MTTPPSPGAPADAELDLHEGRTPVLDAGELYRLLHDGTPGDVEFYLRVCQDSESVLELGAGWGRLAIPLARQGQRVVAVDRDGEHLSRASKLWREEAGASDRLVVHQADLLELDLTERFDRVLLPYNVLYALGGEANVTRAFRVALRHLSPDGEIWFDVYGMDGFDAEARDGSAPGSDDDRDLVAQPLWNGSPLDVYERTSFDPSTRRLDVEYEAESNGQPLLRTRLTHHYLLTSQLEACLAAAGLELAVAWGGFDGGALDEDAELFVGCAVPSSA